MSGKNTVNYQDEAAIEVFHEGGSFDIELHTDSVGRRQLIFPDWLRIRLKKRSKRKPTVDKKRVKRIESGERE